MMSNNTAHLGSTDHRKVDRRKGFRGSKINWINTLHLENMVDDDEYPENGGVVGMGSLQRLRRRKTTFLENKEIIDLMRHAVLDGGTPTPLAQSMTLVPSLSAASEDGTACEDGAGGEDGAGRHRNPEVNYELCVKNIESILENRSVVDVLTPDQERAIRRIGEESQLAVRRSSNWKRQKKECILSSIRTDVLNKIGELEDEVSMEEKEVVLGEILHVYSNLRLQRPSNPRSITRDAGNGMMGCEAVRSLLTTVSVPPEWEEFDIDTKTELAELLSWKSLSGWDFDIHRVAELSSRGRSGKTADCPLLLLGWAILNSPRSQKAMASSVGKEFECDPDDCGYQFFDDFFFHSETLCNFLRKVEDTYRRDVPYHNNSHGADVTQSLHCLLRMGGQDVRDIYSKCELFSILLAALVHDVGHPGTNNAFQTSARTKYALRYNDRSVLENYHASVASSLLFGEDTTEEFYRSDDWDLLQGMTPEQRTETRHVMIRAVLATDMTLHFEDFNEIKNDVDEMMMVLKKAEGDDTNGVDGASSTGLLSLLAKELNADTEGEGGAEKKTLKNLPFRILKYVIHLADISNPAKRRGLAVGWADRMLEESFAQGDLEKERGLPVSPLCDRLTVTKPESQVGFIQFVIQPAYNLLGRIVPRVREEVVPIIAENLVYWQEEMARMRITT